MDSILSDVRRAQSRYALLCVVLRWSNNDADCDQVTECRARSCLPIFWDYADLGLFVARLQVHENPIFCRWQLTFASSSATRPTICGMGVSYPSASSFMRWVRAWLMRSISPWITASRAASHLSSTTRILISDSVSLG